MWRFKPFTHKEQHGLEGRIIDIGSFKVQVRNVIAEGGFSRVYSARDAIHGSKLFALKHIICNDEESLELAMKEISVMKSLKGHPNVVALCAHAVFDMGRTKEILLLMECCEKSLVNLLESGGAVFEEKQVLTIFRDVCNAVFAMHCHSPPIAHRDLKAENLLLGSDGLWKLCDFGSTSTNHKRFEKPEEMGIEEDNIRKYTTPAYRAPEMWDLFRRELINEKVDIWALGCLLFRICYFKLAFDGESKLQILNGNYRIPDLPEYNSSLTDLIGDMLQSSPDDRPDITQVWFRVNSLLPEGSQKSLPDRPPEMPPQTTDVLAGMPKPANKSNPMPRRSPPPPPSAGARNASLVPNNLRTGESAGPFGAFWTSEHAKDSVINEDESRPKYDEDGTNDTSSGHDKICPEKHPASSYSTPSKEQNFQSSTVQKNTPGRSVDRPSFEKSPFPDDSNQSRERFRPPKPEEAPTFQNDAFNAFVAEFGGNKKSPGTNGQRSEKEEFLGAELKKVREQLAHANTEKAEITSKYEKLSAICQSQLQEIQDLKQALAARTPSTSKDQPRNQSSTTPPNEKIEGTVWELQQGLFDGNSRTPDSQQWQAFTVDCLPQTLPPNNNPKSVRTRNGRQGKKPIEPSSATNVLGFGSENFKADPSDSSKIHVPMGGLSKSQRFGESKSVENKLDPQPAGWAGF